MEHGKINGAPKQDEIERSSTWIANLHWKFMEKRAPVECTLNQICNVLLLSASIQVQQFELKFFQVFCMRNFYLSLKKFRLRYCWFCVTTHCYQLAAPEKWNSCKCIKRDSTYICMRICMYVSKNHTQCYICIFPFVQNVVANRIGIQVLRKIYRFVKEPDVFLI